MQGGGYGIWIGGAWASWQNEVNFLINFGAVGTPFLRASFPRADLVLNQWTHLVGTWDGSTMRIYQDGVLKASTPTSGAVVHNALNVMVGAELTVTPGVPDKFFDGTIDQVRIYDRPLCQTDIQALASSGR